MSSAAGRKLPHDHPYAGRPRRIYVAVTNHCNRACPWCSMYSSPDGGTFITEERFRAVLPASGPFELQLEGGEPTTHPLFDRFVQIGRAARNCTRIVLCTNGTRLPRSAEKLEKWLVRLGRPLTVKMSINHYLLDRDPGLLDLAAGLAAICPPSDPALQLVLNVRLRRGIEQDDAAVLERVSARGLLPRSNVFYLQRYGLATDQSGWDEPFAVADNFELINPDGRAYGHDLVRRSEAMRILT